MDGCYVSLRYFFFSSRRRHTRLQGDWSSDVCSSDLIRDVLRGELRFQGVVFSDDLSMGGAAAAYGDVVARARQALSAGCDVLPVCNNRASVIELLDHLDAEPQPASSLRLVRLHGRAGTVRSGLEASAEWTHARELLARAAAAPAL